MAINSGCSSGVDLVLLRNRTFDELVVGDCASMERTLTTDDLRLFAMMSGDTDLQTIGPEQATTGSPPSGTANGLWGGAMFSVLLGTRLPGTGTTIRQQSLRFLGPLRAGDRLTLRVEVIGKDAATGTVRLACSCIDSTGNPIIEGEAEVVAPVERIEYVRTALPDIRPSVDGDEGLGRLLAYARSFEPIRVAVVHACDATSLGAAIEARAAGLIEPVLVAPRARLGTAADEAGVSLDDLEIVDAPHSHAAAARAAELARDGEVEALMKGSLHTDELMSAVVASSAGLRTKRRASHCFVLQTPHYPRPFIVTDAAINLAPDLAQKADIIRNAIDLAHVIGVADPRVAILAAVETVSPSMPATLDAAALCKMAERKQITGGILDGPLGFDNAVSEAAARTKGIVSPVAGRADILIAPDLDAGNMLAKQLHYLADADAAGIVVGARVPIVLTSRADDQFSRMAASAIALLLADRKRGLQAARLAPGPERG